VTLVDARAKSMLRGAIVCESLKPGTVLEGYPLEVTRLSRYEVGDAAEWQPNIWTLIEFEASADDSDALAHRLSRDLDSPGWYANLYSDKEVVVVFPDKIFRYKRGSKTGRQRAQEYARACGVPEPQLDWDD
jgi:hypothetical protein